MDFDIENDDEIFFGLPEEEVDFSNIDHIWEQTVKEQEEAFVEAPLGKPSKAKAKAAASNKTQKPRLQCSHCAKTYANERTLKTHMSAVRLKGVASRAPDMSILNEHMTDLCVSALLQVKENLTVGIIAEECAEYSNKLAIFIRQCDASVLLEFLTSEFLQMYQFSEVVLLSNLRDLVTSSTNKLLNSQSFRSELKKICREAIECSEELLNFFIGNFIISLSNKVLLFTCQRLQGQSPQDAGPKKQSNDDFSSIEFKQLVHYIGGSVVVGVNRRRRNYPSAAHIQSFASIMNKTFVEDKEDPATWCEPQVKEWTEAQNRGGLCYISKNAFYFFHDLVSFVMCHEEEDGSVLIDKVISSVSDNFQIIELWDVLVAASIEIDSSLEWLSSIVEVICRCVSKGIIKRRLNNALKKPVSNIAHRSKMAH